MFRVLFIAFTTLLTTIGTMPAKAWPPSHDRPPGGANAFWEWFVKHSEAYLTLEDAREALFDDLAAELAKVDENLTFEFGPPEPAGKREFVISANGIRSSFPAVLNLVKKAPLLQKWTIIAFRQPKDPAFQQLQYGPLQINDKDVFFKYAEDGKLLHLQIYLLGYRDNLEWKSLAYLMLDQIIGEYDTETQIGYLEFKPLEEDDRYILLPITSLPAMVAEHKAKQKK